MTLELNSDAVFDAFWATALEDAQHVENEYACEDGREPRDVYGDVSADREQEYRDAIAKVCELAAPLIAAQNPNTFPRVCPDGDLNAVFGSDLYMTSHGHGVGFWDGDWEPIGDELTEIAKHAPSGDLCEHIDGGYFFM